MTYPKSQVVSIRLNSEVIRQGELKAREKGDQNISALTKRLLIEHLSSDQKSKTEDESEQQKKILQNNFEATENLRKLFIQSFTLLFSATGKGIEFSTLIQDIEREWKQIVAANELISRLLIEQPNSSQLSIHSAAENASQKSSQRMPGNKTENSEPLQNIHEDEIRFFDDFSSEKFIAVTSNNTSQSRQSQFANVVNESKQIQ